MSESTIRELLRSTEMMLSERFRVMEDVMRLRPLGGGEAGGATTSSDEDIRALNSFKEGFQKVTIPGFVQAFKDINQRLDRMEARLEALKGVPQSTPCPCDTASPLIPAHPLEGLEVIPKREVVVEPVAAPKEAISKEDRLLLNRAARKALEAEEMGESYITDHPDIDGGDVEDSEDEAEEEKDVVMVAAEETVEEEVVEEAEAEEVVEEEVVEEEVVEEEVVEEEVVEEEVVEEEVVKEEVVEEEVVKEAEADEEDVEMEEAVEEAVELEEFEYRGITYYRDGEGNVFKTDEAGELVDEPIGIWNEAKQRIVVKKPAA